MRDESGEELLVKAKGMIDFKYHYILIVIYERVISIIKQYSIFAKYLLQSKDYHKIFINKLFELNLFPTFF